MLQFNKSENTNTNAVWIDTPNTSSNYYSSLAVVYSQSYDNSNGTFSVVTVSAPNQYRNWLVIQNTGSLVPSPSGQYSVQLYTYTSVDAIWNQVATAWDSYDQTWEAAGAIGIDELIYSDRAYVSGSNETTIKQYVSPDENGTYTTYNG